MLWKQIRSKKNSVVLVTVFALALLSLAASILDRSIAVQASLPTPGKQGFIGEYSMDGETWYPLMNDQKITACGSDLYLRGHFSREIQKDASLGFFSDHLAVTISVNGERWYVNSQAGFHSMGYSMFPALCGRTWEMARSPGIGVEDEIEIHLRNMHGFGSQQVFSRFLSTLHVGIGSNMDLLRSALEPYTRLSRIVGALLIVAGFLQLGASTAFSRQSSAELLCAGLMCLCAGVFFLYDAFDLPFWSDSAVLNTCLRQCSIILCVQSMEIYICGGLAGKQRKAAQAATYLSGGMNALIFLSVALGRMVIYDGMLWWGICQAVVCSVLIICCVWELIRGERRNRLIAASGALMLAAVLLDIFGVCDLTHSSANCSKVMFVILFGVHAVNAIRIVGRNQQASYRVANLEKELEESRFDVALSQIQPHFLYNALGSIYHLCGKDPERAQKAVSDFSDYLRMNLGSIHRKTPVSFETELRHVETYLELEKMSAGDELSYCFDIQTTAFSLPALSLQPIVENAVKHGVLRSPGGGEVTVSTREYDDRYEITVADNGVGFAPESTAEDHSTHIGIRNVRQRLSIMCGGTLDVNSTPGCGATAVITLPKGGPNNDHSCAGR